MDATQQALLNEVAEKAAKTAVEETLLRLGVDYTDPLSMQADFRHLREWREATQSIRDKSVLVLVGIMVSALVGACWAGFVSYFQK